MRLIDLEVVQLGLCASKAPTHSSVQPLRGQTDPPPPRPLLSVDNFLEGKSLLAQRRHNLIGIIHNMHLIQWRKKQFARNKDTKETDSIHHLFYIYTIL